MAQKTQELFWWRLSHILIKTYVFFKWNNDRCWSWTLWRLKFLLPKICVEKPDTASLRKHGYSNRSIWVNNGSQIRRCPVFKVVYLQEAFFQISPEISSNYWVKYQTSSMWPYMIHPFFHCKALRGTKVAENALPPGCDWHTFSMCYDDTGKIIPTNQPTEMVCIAV